MISDIGYPLHCNLLEVMDTSVSYMPSEEQGFSLVNHEDMGTYQHVSPGIKKKGKDYFLDYRDAGGRRVREKIGPSKKLAEDVLRKRLLERTEEVNGKS